jgi:hypothetical protein
MEETPFGSRLRVRANAYDWTALDIDEVVPESANDLRFAARHAGKGSNFTWPRVHRYNMNPLKNEASSE